MVPNNPATDEGAHMNTGGLVHPDWLRRLNLFGDAVGSASLMVPLDPDEMLETAAGSVGCSDFGDEHGWETGYRAMVAALEENAALTVFGRLSARGEILRNLQTRLRLVDLWQRHPSIRSEPVVAPVFILGPPRTGTSILLELLALDPGLRPVIAHEAHHPLGPLPDTGDGTALQISEPEQEFWADVHPEFITMHELRSDLPCECLHFVQPEFRSWHWAMMHGLGDVESRHDTQAMTAIYAFHKGFLQTMQYLDGEPQTFLLKSPAHLGSLPELLAQYPDAKLIHTHRDPLKFIGSSANLTGVLHWMRSDAVDMAGRGPLMTLAYQFMLSGVIAQRESGAVPAQQMADIHFVDLMSDPVGAIRRAYEHLNIPFPEEMAESVPAYLADKPKGKFGPHRYEASRLGLDESRLRDDFSDYIDHYGVTLES
ncbi:MAG: sulfotransferase [Acidimicrobiaceae bacterium]|nr:sulfotransferase [Acidimicrobiaceae bacterium]MYA74870.1 sulfotransferase [Acidimicrobiaceae bacterium]MYD05698.1 sulfotransferase [Acidimicrobiaceae bacterium]MYG56032.1 sulfotransferase [Acidimicrobiaceae bacterium]MYI57723.1 sulfotransferase [Acidimicrobiaceae bacterium]